MSQPLNRRQFVISSTALALATGALGCSSLQALNQPPSGFTPLFNGRDLTGFRGGDTYDHRKLLSLPESDRAAQIAKWTKTLTEIDPKTGKPNWHVENGELVNGGNGAYATTEKDYGDFELLLEYKTVPLADSGIYLRGVPQVQIWDFTEKAKFELGAGKGSGGLWNNSPGAPGKDPLVLADKPFGQWNSFRIVMVGARVSVWLNGKQVVKHAIMENYYDRKQPVPARGPIQLQTHGGEIRWRNVFIREISGAEANKILAAHGGEGFKSIWNGKDFAGWQGAVADYEVVNGAIRCKQGKGGNLLTKAEYGDFAFRAEVQVPSGCNNGFAVRCPENGDAAYSAMTELQILAEDYGVKHNYKLDPRQGYGSAYGMVAAHQGYQRPNGEWNFQETYVQGSRIRTELNGFVILDCDLSKVTDYMANSPHPGKTRTRGHFGFAGHNDPVAFRNLSVKEL